MTKSGENFAGGKGLKCHQNFAADEDKERLRTQIRHEMPRDDLHEISCLIYAEIQDIMT